ncbi:MAG: hypothetical protein RMZ43_033745 [Nostoc sp. CmiVER01]|uniref:hypothetical protein n=1 Tax=Nostoc sp. CmiVER01 TaxID=3075384 RepID=UPI002AD462A3|nr:hypothetical protein [Nostoc sp. CmiVER01]MDZ8126597.1 hypothetical protein [Nostoc sp. CmiVER01]
MHKCGNYNYLGGHDITRSPWRSLYRNRIQESEFSINSVQLVKQRGLGGFSHERLLLAQR